MPTKYEQKQIRLRPEVLAEVKVLAARQQKNLNDVYDDAMVEFFKEREELGKERAPEDYYAYHTNSAKPQNVTVHPKHFNKLTKIAEKDDVSTSRVIYTGIIKYLKKRNVLP